MQVKRVKLVQDIRDAFPEANSAAQVERWATETIPQLESLSSSARQLRASMTGGGEASPTAVPPEVVQALSTYQDIAHDVILGAELLRTVILCRIPELKEEDNLGVAVQMAVLKQLDGVAAKLQGGAGDDKGGAALAASAFTLKGYFAARAAVEEKLLGKPSDNEEASKAGAGTKSPSAKLELRQTDIDAVRKVELAAAQLATLLRGLVAAYGLNFKKLIQPRVQNDRMVS